MTINLNSLSCRPCPTHQATVPSDRGINLFILGTYLPGIFEPKHKVILVYIANTIILIKFQLKRTGCELWVFLQTHRPLRPTCTVVIFYPESSVHNKNFNLARSLKKSLPLGLHLSTSFFLGRKIIVKAFVLRPRHQQRKVPFTYDRLPEITMTKLLQTGCFFSRPSLGKQEINFPRDSHRTKVIGTNQITRITTGIY